ncbi:MAG: glycerophosphodiester phosphodiesterase family protein [Sphaerochaeta sp.]|nr:glycerophosphodiester phosphodiesterase family protein [Sphaerochaeta sp.]
MSRKSLPFAKPLLFGHRGYSSLKPENTLASFQLCVEKGIPGVELDVQQCKTGELVIVHDADMVRVAGRDALVSGLSFDELRSLDVGEGEQVPLLSELFELCGERLYYDIELKVPGLNDGGLAQKTWQTIQDFGLEGRCMISSFNPFALRRFNRISKHALPSAVIFDESPSVPRPFHHGWGRHIGGASLLKPPMEQLDEAFVRKFKGRKHYSLCVWTVDDIAEGTHAVQMGADGLISNDPAIFLPLVGLEKGREQQR